MSADVVDAWVESARALLPPQNPLWAFLHNNALVAFEGLPFAEGVREAAALYRARPTESEAFFRAELARGRITRASLDAALADAMPNDRVARFLADARACDDLPPLTARRVAARLARATRASSTSAGSKTCSCPSSPRGSTRA